MWSTSKIISASALCGTITTVSAYKESSEATKYSPDRPILSDWRGLTELIPDIRDFVLKNGYGRGSEIRIEPKANGLDVIDALVKYEGLNAVRSYNPVDDKIYEAHLVTPELKAGRVLLLEDGRFVGNYLSEVTLFPKSKYSDQVDTTVMP